MEDKKPDYSIDDILAELALNQQRRRQRAQAPASPQEPAAERDGAPAAASPAPSNSATSPAAAQVPDRAAAPSPAEQTPAASAPPAPVQPHLPPDVGALRDGPAVVHRPAPPAAEETELSSRPSFWARRRQRRDEEEEAAWQALSAPAAAEPPASRQHKTADTATRVLDIPGNIPADEPAGGPAADEAEDRQLRMEDLVEPASTQPETVPSPSDASEPDDLEEQLQKARQKKVEEFRKIREERQPDFRLSGDEEEDNDPSEEPESYEDEELEDYGSYEETAAVHNELAYRRRTGWIGCLLTLALELVLVCLALIAHLTGAPPMETYLYIGLNAFLLLFMMLVNHQLVGGGLASLARMQADGDSVAALSALAAFIHTLVQFFRPDGVSSGLLELLAPAAGLSLLLGALGRQARVLRICANFRFVSYPGDKFEAKKIEDLRTAEEIGRPAVALGEPQVAYFKPARFLSRFLENSYAPDGSETVMRLFTPALLLVSLLLGVGCGLLRGDWWMALTVFTSTVCLCTPAAMSAVHFPLLRTAKAALARGGMISGWKAVETFGHLHGVVVDAAELFPSESVLLHGIKTFAGARIDEAILDAAAVSIKAGGPLAAVFRRVIENRLDILPAVDSLVYEQDMGLSGWVAGRRVLVGNRRLLENHGVDVPSRDYELRYTQNNRQLVYLSTAGELSAMFVISYTADEGIAEALHALEKAHITLLVRTCDPNVTEELICRTLDIDGYYVEMLNNAAGRTYGRLLEETEGETPAVLASNGRIEGMAAALVGCHRLRIGAGLGLTVQIVAAGLGVALNAVLAFRSGMVFPAFYTLAYLGISSVLSWILPCLKRY